MSNTVKYNAEQIKLLFEQYKEWLLTQYVCKPDMIKSGERAGEQINIKIPKPQTIQSFVLFIGTNKQTFYDMLYNENGIYPTALTDCITQVHDYIQDYQVSGAIVGMFNPAIVMAMNGIQNTVNVNSNVSVQALPSAIKNSVIDLTDAEFDVLNE
jgi:hypothetical protein